MRLSLLLVTLSLVSSGQDLIQPADYGSIYFNYQRGSALPLSQVLPLGSEERRPVTILSVVGSWLTASPNTDGGPDTLSLKADPSGLQPGIYEGSLFFAVGDGFGTANI